MNALKLTRLFIIVMLLEGCIADPLSPTELLESSDYCGYGEVKFSAFIFAENFFLSSAWKETVGDDVDSSCSLKIWTDAERHVTNYVTFTCDYSKEKIERFLDHASPLFKHLKGCEEFDTSIIYLDYSSGELSVRYINDL